MDAKDSPIFLKRSARFVPHYNRALGKMYHTKEDYLSDMKKGGYIPYREGDADKAEASKWKPFEPSQEALSLMKAWRQSKGKVGDVWKSALEARYKAVGKRLKPSQTDLAKLPKHYQPGQGGGFTEE